MSEINKNSVLQRLNLNEEQGNAIINAALENPLQALSMLQEYNPDPQALQELMTEFMNNPEIFVDMARDLGFSDEKIASIKAKFGV